MLLTRKQISCERNLSHFHFVHVVFRLGCDTVTHVGGTFSDSEPTAPLRRSQLLELPCLKEDNFESCE
jgi:hypothetical protein